MDATNVHEADSDNADVEQRRDTASGEVEQAEGDVGIHQAPRDGWIDGAACFSQNLKVAKMMAP